MVRCGTPASAARRNKPNLAAFLQMFKSLWNHVGSLAPQGFDIKWDRKYLRLCCLRQIWKGRIQQDCRQGGWHDFLVLWRPWHILTWRKKALAKLDSASSRFASCPGMASTIAMQIKPGWTMFLRSTHSTGLVNIFPPTLDAAGGNCILHSRGR